MTDELRSTERLLFRLTDDESIPKDKKIFTGTTWREANKWNENQWGIFWSINLFNGKRSNANLKEFLAWAIDLDDDDKKTQSERIKNFLEPSMVVESKNGFHVYYFAEKDTETKNFKEIMINHLIPNLNADKGVNDLARVLRVPNFLHWKDTSDPFMVKIVHYSGKKYSEKQIISGFPPKTDLAKKTIADTSSLRKTLKSFGHEKIWDRVYNFDCEYALSKLSGTSAVNGETFSFQRVSRGHMNIWVDDKITASFIDKDKRIGSRNRGGPTIWQWVNWYHNDHKKTYKLLKQYLPELFEDQK